MNLVFSEQTQPLKNKSMKKIFGFVGATIFLSVFLLVIFLSGCKKNEIPLSEVNKSLSENKLKSAPSTNIKVLYVGIQGDPGQPDFIQSGFSNGMQSEMNARTYITAQEKLYDLYCGHNPPDNAIPWDWYKLSDGTNPDVIILCGSNGNTCNYNTSIDNLVHAADGTNASIPQMHSRCNMVFWCQQYADQWAAQGYQEGYMYRELCGEWVDNHDCNGTNYDVTFPGAGDVCLNSNTSGFSAPANGFYYANKISGLNNSLVSLVHGYTSYGLQCETGRTGAEDHDISWRYLYKGSVRMWTHVANTIGWSSDRTSDFNDQMARALIWSAGKDQAIYLKGGTPTNYTTIPAKIEAEAYSSMSGVQLEGTTDTGGGQNIGWIDNGDWMNYNIHVNSAGTFNVDLRVASQPGGGSLQLRSGSTILKSISVPNTGGWQNWTTVNSGNISLSAGDQVIQVYATGWGWNINWLQFNGGVGGPSTPTVSTNSISNITQTSASSGGNVISDGGASVSARGVCWSTSANPTTSNSKTSNGSGIGIFNSSISGLSANTTYHVRAYSTNSAGTGYGNDLPFTTSGSGGGFTDPTINGGWESGNMSPWNNYSGPQVTSSSPQAGTYCIGFNNGGSCEQVVTGLTANTTYTLHGWGKAVSGNSVAIGVKDFGGTEINSSITATSWTQGNVTFTTGSSNTSARIYAFQNGGTGAVWVDSYSITKN